MSISQIIEGTVNNFLNKNADLYKERIAICFKCKLLIRDEVFGDLCNNKLYLNPMTNETSTTDDGIGFKKGCGCILSSKTRVKEATCPVGKW